MSDDSSTEEINVNASWNYDFSLISMTRQDFEKLISAMKGSGINVRQTGVLFNGEEQK